MDKTNRQKVTERHRYGQQGERNRQKRTETDRKGQKQTETDRNGQKRTERDRNGGTEYNL